MKILSTLAAILYVTALNGWAFSVLWKWFIAGTFGLPEITIPHAAGLGIIAVYFRRPVSRNKDMDHSEWLFRGLGWATFNALFSLGLGAITNYFQ